MPSTIQKPKIGGNSDKSPMSVKPPAVINKIQKAFDFNFIKVLVSEKSSKSS